jgi:putative N6-adenine-specific DNA methylase
MIAAVDLDSTAIEAARTNCQTLPGGNRSRFWPCPFQQIDSLKDTTILCNPPYGRRLNTAQETAALLHKFGTFLKDRCQGSTAYIYLGNETLLQQIRSGLLEKTAQQLGD